MESTIHISSRWLRIALMGFGLLGWALPARAQASPSPGSSLTLAEAVRMALAQNPRFRSASDEAQAARARARAAKAPWLPQVDFSQSFTRGDNPVYVFGTLLTQRSFTAANFALPSLNAPAPLDNFQTRLDGRLSLFDSGETRYQSQTAQRLVSAADFETEQARQDLILAVVRAYYGVLLAREDVAASAESVRAAKANRDRIESLQHAGMVVDSDLLSAEVFLAQMKDRQIRAQDSLELARLELARQTGMAADSAPEPSAPLSPPSSPAIVAADWVHMALEHRPALKAAELQKDAASSRKKAAKAEFGPKIGLFANLERDALTLGGPSGTNWTAGARLDFNIFSGGASRSRLEEAEAAESYSRHGLEWFRSGVVLEVRKACLDVTAAEERTATARGAVAQAQESLRIVQNRYAAGLTGITELLQTQAAQLDAKTAYLSAVHDWQVARAEMERSAGTLTTGSGLLHPGRNP